MLHDRFSLYFIAQKEGACFKGFLQLKCCRTTKEGKVFGELRANLTQRGAIPLQGVMGAFTQAVGRRAELVLLVCIHVD